MATIEKVQELMNNVRMTEPPEGHSLVAVLVDENGKADMAGTARPEVLKAIGVHFIEMAVRAEIKAAL